jgi:hypothetical protein
VRVALYLNRGALPRRGSAIPSAEPMNSSNSSSSVSRTYTG